MLLCPIDLVTKQTPGENQCGCHDFGQGAFKYGELPFGTGWCRCRALGPWLRREGLDQGWSQGTAVQRPGGRRGVSEGRLCPERPQQETTGAPRPGNARQLEGVWGGGAGPPGAAASPSPQGAGVHGHRSQGRWLQGWESPLSAASALVKQEARSQVGGGGEGGGSGERRAGLQHSPQPRELPGALWP